jgi:hypothetical protein
VIEFDTTAVANGAHQIALVVTDADGNRTTSVPVSVTVRNSGAANGARASRFARLEAWFETRTSKQHRTSATLGYGTTRATVGRLSDETDDPVSDAMLDIAASTTRPGSPTKTWGQVTTDASDRFRCLRRSGASRKLIIGYRAFSPRRCAFGGGHDDRQRLRRGGTRCPASEGVGVAVSRSRAVCAADWLASRHLRARRSTRTDSGHDGPRKCARAVSLPVPVPQQFAWRGVSIRGHAAPAGELSVRDGELAACRGADPLSR